MCAFCQPELLTLVATSHYFYAIRDRAPVTEGHTLIIPRAHRTTVLDLTKGEHTDLFSFRKRVVSQLESEFGVSEFNFGTNCGQAAGQTVMHFHEHVIPRRKGDVENPRGGVRNLMKPLRELWPDE